MSKQTQVVPAEFAVHIDFDEASEGWMANKLKLANGMYRYICGVMTLKGTKCRRSPGPSENTCAYHLCRSPAKVASKPSSDTKSVITHVRMMFQDGQVLSKKYSPVADEHTPQILSIKTQTIRVPSTPGFKHSFTMLRCLMNSFGTSSLVSSLELLRYRRNQIHDVVLCYLLVWSFLEGMKQMTKLETKHPSIVIIQSRILVFYEYTGIETPHLTLSQWSNITEEIQEHTKTILRELIA